MQVRGRRLVSGRWSRPLLAMLAGGLPVFAFPAPSLWWVACVALVPWIQLIRSAPTGRRAVADGWWGELGFVLAVHHWLLPSTHVLTGAGGAAGGAVGALGGVAGAAAAGRAAVTGAGGGPGGASVRAASASTCGSGRTWHGG
ncbi:hypothetical protein GCM10010499_08990 [Streptomyces thermoviolaceus subsp. apingens]|nr:hypothetical protein GCM10010499_08990 [Streptomyces thermoviolaceus subsp. apingens]